MLHFLDEQRLECWRMPRADRQETQEYTVDGGGGWSLCRKGTWMCFVKYMYSLGPHTSTSEYIFQRNSHAGAGGDKHNGDLSSTPVRGEAQVSLLVYQWGSPLVSCRGWACAMDSQQTLRSRVQWLSQLWLLWSPFSLDCELFRPGLKQVHPWI